MDVTAILAAVAYQKYLLLLFGTLALFSYKWPAHVDVEDKATYHYIVVGSGTGGSLLASRLSEIPHIKVLLIEAGDDAKWETGYGGMFPYLTKTDMDWNFTAEDDGYACQYIRNENLDLPAGKCMGGSSSMHHLYNVRGCVCDYDLWAEASSDDVWTWWKLLPYFKKSERLEDPYLLNSDSAYFHGTDGLIGFTRETRNETLVYMDAFAEVGHRIVDDINTNDSVGFARPLFYISKDGMRQSSAESFLIQAKDRPNLHVMKNTLVTKVIFDDDLNAIGVECIKPNGENITIYASKEIILSAGTYNTAKILMLSGIGPEKDLQNVSIPVIIDSPVGQRVQDHVAVILAHVVGESNATATAQNPSDFPVPTFVGVGPPGGSCGEYVTLNLLSDNSPATLLLLCAVVFNLHDDVCNQLAVAGEGTKVLFTVMNKARPVSTGTVGLRSSNPLDPPLINMGYFSNSTDLNDTAAYIQNYINVTNSSHFQSVGGYTLLFDLPNCVGLDTNTTEYWICYCLNMMYTTFHYSGSCPMGKVVDSRLRVNGVTKLRVGDASVMPNQMTGNINTAVMVIAERLADMILEDNNETTCSL